MNNNGGTGKYSGWQEVWSLAAPSSAVFFMVTLGNLLTIKIVSGLGGDAIAALTTAARFYNIFNALLMGLSAGTLAMISRAWGGQQRERAAQLLQTSLLIAIGLGVTMTAVLILLTPLLLTLFNLSAGAVEFSITYIERFALFFASIAAYVILASGLRACGDAKTPMLFAALINVLIVLLCYWFTYGGLGLPAYGIKGAAWGVGCGNIIGVGTALLMWWRGKLRLARPQVANPERWQDLKKLWSLGYPAALEQCILQIGVLAYLWVVADYGTAAYAAYGIGLTLLSLSMVIGYGFAMAGSILVGQQMGTNNIEGARQAGWRAMRQSFVILVTLSLILAPFADELALWLAGDPEVGPLHDPVHVCAVSGPALHGDRYVTGRCPARCRRHPLSAAGHHCRTGVCALWSGPDLPAAGPVCHLGIRRTAGRLSDQESAVYFPLPLECLDQGHVMLPTHRQRANQFHRCRQNWLPTGHCSSHKELP